MSQVFLYTHTYISSLPTGIWITIIFVLSLQRAGDTYISAYMVWKNYLTPHKYTFKLLQFSQEKKIVDKIFSVYNTLVFSSSSRRCLHVLSFFPENFWEMFQNSFGNIFPSLLKSASQRTTVVWDWFFVCLVFKVGPHS